MAQLDPQEAALIKDVRVARLATADANGVPHLVPICFAYDGGCFYSVLDRKPKRAPLEGLKRVRNISSNPRVSLLVDHYEEDWGGLWYVLVTGTAEIIRGGEEHRRAVQLLRDKYAQYRGMDVADKPVIKVTPTGASSWGTMPDRASSR